MTSSCFLVGLASRDQNFFKLLLSPAFDSALFFLYNKFLLINKEKRWWMCARVVRLFWAQNCSRSISIINSSENICKTSWKNETTKTRGNITGFSCKLYNMFRMEEEPCRFSLVASLVQFHIGAFARVLLFACAMSRRQSRSARTKEIKRRDRWRLQVCGMKDFFYWTRREWISSSFIYCLSHVVWYISCRQKIVAQLFGIGRK